VASRTPQAALPANAWTLLLLRRILARDQLNLYLQVAWGKEGQQWKACIQKRFEDKSKRGDRRSAKPSTN
jgi:hypothetical protein